MTVCPGRWWRVSPTVPGPSATGWSLPCAPGCDAGGEAGPVHSAGLLLVDTVSWPVAELRCDWTEDCPVAAVEAAWAVYKPQLAAYVQHARDPRAAPSYGVPGDEG